MKPGFRCATIFALVLPPCPLGRVITFREATVPDLKVPVPTSVYLLDWVALGPFSSSLWSRVSLYQRPGQGKSTQM